MAHHIIFCIKLCLIASLCAFITSCDVHEFASAASNFDVTLNLHFDSDMPLHQTVTFSRDTQDFLQCYTIRIYRMNDYGKCSESPEMELIELSDDTNFTDYTANLNLQSGYYRVVAVADYVDSTTHRHRYNLSSQDWLTVDDDYKNIGNTESADVFFAVKYIAVGSEDEVHVYDVEMKRPVARYEIIATDVDEFIAEMQLQDKEEMAYGLRLREFRTHVSYTGFKPSEFNLLSNSAIDAELGLAYDGSLRVLNNGQAVIGFDYVLVGPLGTSVNIALTICDKDGTEIAKTSTITVPLAQGKLTVVKGNFMTTQDDGIGINPDFVGPDYNYQI